MELYMYFVFIKIQQIGKKYKSVHYPKKNLGYLSSYL